MILYLPDIARYLTKAQCKRLRLCEDNEVYKEFAWYLEELCVSLGFLHRFRHEMNSALKISDKNLYCRNSWQIRNFEKKTVHKCRQNRKKKSATDQQQANIPAKKGFLCFDRVFVKDGILKDFHEMRLMAMRSLPCNEDDACFLEKDLLMGSTTRKGILWGTKSTLTSWADSHHLVSYSNALYFLFPASRKGIFVFQSKLHQCNESQEHSTSTLYSVWKST